MRSSRGEENRLDVIYIVSLQANEGPVVTFLQNVDHAVKGLKHLCYERLFRDRRAPFGHYVFTDIDRLSHYEREIAVALSDALRRVDPAVHILNDPRDVLERYPLLKLLEREGINHYTVTRLDDGARPDRYPVFVRSEDSHHGADTDLLHSPQELECALTELKAQGKVLKRRIAIEFRGERCEDGFYRKYGVINVGGCLVPQHVLRGQHWQIKNRSGSSADTYAEEELAFIRENPHREDVARVFQLANIDYGRVDYSMVDGQVQVYEINTNPHFPRQRRKANESDLRAERRRLSRQRLVEAVERINTPLPKERIVAFELPQPVYHEMRAWRPIRNQVARYRRWLHRHPDIKRLIPGRFW